MLRWSSSQVFGWDRRWFIYKYLVVMFSLVLYTLCWPQWSSVAKRIRYWRSGVKVASSNPDTAGQLTHLALLCWLQPLSGRTMCVVISLPKEVKNKRKKAVTRPLSAGRIIIFGSAFSFVVLFLLVSRMLSFVLRVRARTMNCRISVIFGQSFRCSWVYVLIQPGTPSYNCL